MFKVIDHRFKRSAVFVPNPLPQQNLNHYLGASTASIQRETAAETCTGRDRNAPGEANFH
jgi:hypothetical protein